MRIDELHLLAYGKFTDHSFRLPQAAHDFHVIIGPNEAGKSTLRRAITELLFGMQRQSPLGFKHPQADLRLSAVLDTTAGKLAFIRTKQQKSLRSLTDEVLPESYLQPALGALTEDIFTQLHCLDHERLLKGGQVIVDPSSSVSQILFQAASGVEGFTAIRDTLGARATELFASRGRNNEYAKAAERYAAAHKALRDAQVRTRHWDEVRHGLSAAENALEAERRQRRVLETQRSTWERVRRLGPLIERLSRLEQELAALGPTLSFPPHARDTLDHGIAAMDAAEAIVKTREKDVIERQQQLDAITVESEVLALTTEIERLAGLCSKYANHARDLPLRRNEVNQWLDQVFTYSAEFGWGSTEAEVLSKLPQPKAVRAIDSLLKQRGALLADARAAAESKQERQATLEELQATLAGLPELSLNPQLESALAAAAPYKASANQQFNLNTAITLAERTSRNAMAALGRPELTVTRLRSMPLPSSERIAAYRTTRHDLANASALADSLAQANTVADLELQLTQFVRSHKVVTVAEVAAARATRNDTWSAIKSGAAPLPASAPQLDNAIRLADELVDQLTLSETDGAALQALRDRLEQAATAQTRHQNAAADRRRELAEFDLQWAQQATQMELDGMPLDDMPEWLSKRERALQAADALAEKQQQYASEQHSAAAAAKALSHAMIQAGLPATDSPELAVLCTLAESHSRAAEQNVMQRQSLHQQLQSARAAVKQAESVAAVRDTVVTQWRSSWQEALAQAHLTQTSGDPAEVETALRAAELVRQLLAKITSHRIERIATMEGDLKQLNQVATALAAVLAPDLQQRNPEELASTLHSRLEQAKQQASRKSQAQEFLDTAKRQFTEAKSILEQAQRSLEPLLSAASVATPMLALPLVEKAQHKTTLQDAIDATRIELEHGADGLSLQQVQNEVASHAAIDAPAQLLTLQDALNDSERKLTQLMQAELGARQAFDAINGGAQAAVAEAQRQEALADMSQVAEEYLQLATAGKLLSWAVDRYRDRKQGPLLQRASSIFKQLTLESFEMLRVDYDLTPHALLAYRANNQAVKVAGLSDGTRDQLFLALRIAALELQAEQGMPVPFIADDLFINFDDQRSRAGLQALYELSSKTQVLFLSHQEHLLPVMAEMFPQANVITLAAEVTPVTA